MERDEGNFIIVAGNIGAGKTTVAQGLANMLDYKLFRERVADNPYLEDFYKDMKKWSFKLQRFFLFSRTTDHEVASRSGFHAIQDRSIYEDRLVFAQNLYDEGLMDEKEFGRYKMFYDDTVASLRNPDLMVFLRAGLPTVRERIQKRNRDCEKELLDPNNPYLGQLDKLYNSFYKNYNYGPKIEVNVDELDVVARIEDLEKIVAMVEKELHL